MWKMFPQFGNIADDLILYHISDLRNVHILNIKKVGEGTSAVKQRRGLGLVD